MTVREYIGARYVSLFMGVWDNTNTYEPLSVVLYQGNSYTSRQAVPTGIEITNETYWAETGNFNAQVEQYRQEVLSFDGRISAIEPSNDNDNIVSDTEKRYEIADDEKPNIVYEPKLGYNTHASFPTNILPAIRIAQSYMNRSDLVYGNNYTATNVNEANTDFELPLYHKNDNDTMNIDCTTFCQLVAMYCSYQNSGYSRAAGQLPALNNFNFNKTALAYRKWGRGENWSITTNRILSGQWAKMLHDMGELVEIKHISQIQPGMILFMSVGAYDDSGYHWEGINHCVFCIYNVSNSIVVMESNNAFGGCSIGYRNIDSTSEALGQIKYGWMIPQCNIFSGSISGYERNLKLTTNNTWNRTMEREGTVVIYNADSNTHTFEVTITFPNTGNVRSDVVIARTGSSAFSLSAYRSLAFTLPGGATIDIVKDNTQSTWTVKVNEDFYVENKLPYIPES